MKTETVVVIGILAVVFGAPLLKALASGGQDQDPIAQESPPVAVLDPFGGPTRVLDPTAIPTPTPAYSEQVIGGDVVSNDFIPYGPDIVTAGGAVFDVFEFGINPVGSTIEKVLSIF